MNVDLFEGFKRLNNIIILLIFIIGVVLSFQQTEYIDGEIKYFSKSKECIDSTLETKKVNYGKVYIKYCFDDFYDYTFISNYAKNDILSIDEINKYESQLLRKLSKSIAYGILTTIIIIIGYIIFCKAVKYVITGFVKQK